MSIPSSRDVEVTTAFRAPRFSFSSTSIRVSFERLPWWASRSSTPCSFSLNETCSVPLRVFVKIRVVRCFAIRSVRRSYIFAFASCIAYSERSRTGHRTAMSRDFRLSTSTTWTSRSLPFA